jgi:bacillithiol biosynthesis cysteine-adding enzyme BshC
MSLRFEDEAVGVPPQLDMIACAARRMERIDPALQAAFVASGAAEQNLKRLFSNDALCVTTGQQPGLLTGPLYTVHKALSAAALARLMEQRLGRPVVPVFWVAGDDHDFAEANHCYFPSGSHDVLRVVLRERDSAAALTPMFREPVGAEIEAVMQRLADVTRETEFRPRVFEWIRSHYRPESDMATAFGGALAELLAQFGVVVFNPTHADAKRAMAPWILAALQQANGIDGALTQHAEALRELGRSAPIAVGESASTVLIESSLGRDRLLMMEAGFQTRRSKESWRLAELEEVAAKEPQRLSPNVLLRPVIEAALLPTVVYVAGPGEVAYLPQAEPIYRLLGLERQHVIQRWTGRFIESRTARVLTKYGITLDDLSLPEGQLEARVLHDQVPADMKTALDALDAGVREAYGTLAVAAAKLDASLEKHVVAAEHGALRDLAAVEKKIVRYIKENNETAVRQLASARASMFPLGKRQERVFNVAPFLIRYGEEFLEGVYQRCGSWAAALETTTSGA